MISAWNVAKLERHLLGAQREAHGHGVGVRACFRRRASDAVLGAVDPALAVDLITPFRWDGAAALHRDVLGLAVDDGRGVPISRTQTRERRACVAEKDLHPGCGDSIG